MTPELEQVAVRQAAEVELLLEDAWRALLDYRWQHQEPWMHLEEAVWRVADAGLLLRKMIEEGAGNTTIRGMIDGFDEATGRGALLPVAE